MELPTITVTMPDKCMKYEKRNTGNKKVEQLHHVRAFIVNGNAQNNELKNFTYFTLWIIIRVTIRFKVLSQLIECWSRFNGVFTTRKMAFRRIVSVKKCHWNGFVGAIILNNIVTYARGNGCLCNIVSDFSLKRFIFSYNLKYLDAVTYKKFLLKWNGTNQSCFCFTCETLNLWFGEPSPSRFIAKLSISAEIMKNEQINGYQFPSFFNI